MIIKNTGPAVVSADLSLMRAYHEDMNSTKSQKTSTKLQTNLKFLPCGILPSAGSPEAKFHRASTK